MDATYFLKQRTRFIRFYYDTALKPFTLLNHTIEDQLPPFDESQCNEDGEPEFLDQWMDAHVAARILGLSCVSLLSDTLRLYFHALARRVIGYCFEDEKTAFKQGFLAAHLGALRDVLDTDWSDCPVDPRGYRTGSPCPQSRAT